MILFHGTTDKMLKPILRHGLRPRRHTGRSVYNGKLESDPERIYLTDVFAVPFARNAVDQLGGNALFAAVRVDESLLEPDTDFADLYPDWRECLEQTGCVSVRADHLPVERLWRLTKKQTTAAIDLFSRFDPMIPTGILCVALRPFRKDMFDDVLFDACRIVRQFGEWVDDTGKPLGPVPGSTPAPTG